MSPAGEVSPVIEVALDWGSAVEMGVMHGDAGVKVRVHPSLSEAQVRRACDELGDHGPAVFAAWQRAVGITQPAVGLTQP